ncbi:MAG: hypothetical protein R3F59_04830 [Myxococcota bacterium]
MSDEPRRDGPLDLLAAHTVPTEAELGALRRALATRTEDARVAGAAPDALDPTPARWTACAAACAGGRACCRCWRSAG